VILEGLRRSTLDSFILAGFALLTSACLAPPPVKSAGAGAGPNPSSAAGATGPREFTHATSKDLFSKLRIGWNLGNSLDVPEGETAWGNPKVAPELLQAVAKAGFELVRIPVTWAKHTGPAPEFVIEQAFLERVDEVVGYARAAGLYSVINVHHDGADGFKDVEWITLNDEAGKTTPENDAVVRARFTAVWAQIAKHFAGHGEELLFESMNEIHDGYGPPNPRHMEFINELNQEFVTLVRKSAGNNDKRHLIVPGYNTNIDHTLAGFKLPADTTKDRLILSVHYYDPYLYALQAKTNTWGAGAPGRDDWGQEDFVVGQFDKLKAAFVDKGVPVFMGEYGATNQDDFKDYRRYYMEYVTKAAVDRGILPVYWDNGGKGSGGEKFGLMDREKNDVLHPAILEAMMRAAKHSYKLQEIAPPKPSK
jgi:aryl-phospho-beta-D-glucosidase BglC (GH1 family)